MEHIRYKSVEALVIHLVDPNFVAELGEEYPI
jgi:hypothetical protein